MTEPHDAQSTSRQSSKDRFPASDFDAWAETYDREVASPTTFPFDGYAHALETVVQLAEPQRGMSVLDLGTGTGNLAARFAERGCKLWCTDFSQAMLDKTRIKVPAAHLVLHDLRTAWPPELDRRFDRVVSAYAFHHLEFQQKVDLCRKIVRQHLLPDGRLVIADISFSDANAMTNFAVGAGDRWEMEPYWLADETIRALREAGLRVQYLPVSGCAGTYCVEDGTQLRTEN